MKIYLANKHFFMVLGVSDFNLIFFISDLLQGPNGPQGAIGYPGPRGIKVSTLNLFLF